MGISITYNDESYTIPSPGEDGDWANSLNAFLLALASPATAVKVDTTGTPGSATANGVAGISSIKLNEIDCYLANSYVKANSVVLVSLLDFDSACTRIKATWTAGQLTVTGSDAASDGNVRFAWWVVV